MNLATSQWSEKKQGAGTASDEKIFKIHTTKCIVGILFRYWFEQTKYKRHFIGNERKLIINIVWHDKNTVLLGVMMALSLHEKI